MKKGKATSERVSEYHTDGLISKMYRCSGGCDIKHRCGDCRYCIKSDEIRNAWHCELHRTKLIWKRSWIACKFWESRKKSVKIKEEGSGQLCFSIE